MKKSIAFLIVLTCLMTAKAQNSDCSLDGWHLGGRVECNIGEAASMSTSPTHYPGKPYGNYVKSLPTMGWLAGIEASYNFAKYFGVSFGLEFGTSSNIRYKVDGLELDMHEMGYDFHIPVNFEMHIPLKNDWFLFSAVGLRFSNIAGGIEKLSWGDDLSSSVNNIQGDRMTFLSLSREDPYWLAVDANLKLGAMYQLPYGDVLRFGLVANFALCNKYSGEYSVNEQRGVMYDLEVGSISYRHNCYGLEFAYIHCFKPNGK
jgi:hypothetical protein